MSLNSSESIGITVIYIFFSRVSVINSSRWMIWYLPASEKLAKPLTMCENTRSAEWFCGGNEGQGVPANLNYPQQAVCCVALKTQKRELISRRQLPQHLWDSLTWILMSASGPFLKKNVTFWEGLNGGFRFREEFVKATWHLMHLFKLLLKCIHKQKRFTFLIVPAAEWMITEQTLNSRQLHTITIQLHPVVVCLLGPQLSAFLQR